jgi:hypothetical protein
MPMTGVPHVHGPARHEPGIVTCLRSAMLLAGGVAAGPSSGRCSTPPGSSGCSVPVAASDLIAAQGHETGSSAVGQSLLGVLVAGVCALPQFAGLTAPGQPASKPAGGVIVSQVGEHAHHIQVAEPRPPACQ